MKNVGPLLEIKAKRIGGANYQVPIEVNSVRKETLALRWIIDAAKKRKGAPMSEKLAAEMLDAYNGVGAAIKKKEDTHRMAEANKAFAHFARL
jgi:small subunit ribosomal protein S7